ncbi:unnamed protein product [Phytophthora lilii]|uniref:Unnamed protein product n=1 Tax=Phytophthora lilii TaxID=2077276 RepID=A0A9W6XEB0_9STRA|nr:unnamed protein product [Phytophthora lilii]
MVVPFLGVDVMACHNDTARVQHQVHAAAVNVIYHSEALVLPEKSTLRYQLLCFTTLSSYLEGHDRSRTRFEDAREQPRGKPSSVSGLPKPNRKDNRYQQVKGRNSDAKAQNPPKPITTLGGGTPDPSCFTCGVKGHKSPECPRRGNGA